MSKFLCKAINIPRIFSKIYRRPKTNLTLSWRRPILYRKYIEICSANQWTGFYMITASVMKGLNRCKKYCLPMPSHCRCIDCKSHIIANCILMLFKSYNWPIKSIKSSKKFQVTKFYESHVIIDVLCMYQWNYFEHIIYSINYFKQTEPSEKNIFKKI